MFAWYGAVENSIFDTDMILISHSTKVNWKQGTWKCSDRVHQTSTDTVITRMLILMDLLRQKAVTLLLIFIQSVTFTITTLLSVSTAFV